MEPEAFAVIALVCSVGGMAALRDVLGELPADLPAAVVVVQHLSPERESMLAELLAPHSRMELATGTDGAALAPGLVQIAPSGSHCLVTPDLRLSLVGSGPFPPYRPSADLLLTTLALAAGPRVIAVVMTGAGHDGATGTTVVHQHGGVVLATDEATSTNFAMPAAAIARENVDRVVALKDLAATLVELTGSVSSRGRGGRRRRRT